MRLFCGCVVISIHALREEGDASGTQRTPPYGQFLSTPSARRATSWASLTGKSQKFLSTPSARRATQHRSGQAAAERISIHALREEGDRIRHGPAGREVYFYPRPPRGGRRLRPAPEHACGLISIHALREEGDAHKTVKENRKAYFYPRPPRGGRLTREYYYSGREQFLSTPSARRATGAYPRRGAQTSDFYPRPPRGGRPLSFAISPYSADFYPRPPRGGRRIWFRHLYDKP